MCRVFGFRSAIPSGVHHSLLRARNALAVQSHEHPDGWGIACFDRERPSLVHGTGPAFEDGGFSKTAGMVTSQTVLAHLRKASVGAVEPRNCHPFARGRWVFAHNGDIARWAEVRAAVEDHISPELRDSLVGDTDSERCFLIFLTELSARLDGQPLDEAPFPAVAEALQATVRWLRALADPGAEKPSVLTFVVSNGPMLAAVHSGNTLWFSTHKVRCAERDGCALFAASCESPVRTGEAINHLLVASEPLSTENVWHPVPEDAVIGVDREMKLRSTWPVSSVSRERTAISGMGI